MTAVKTRVIAALAAGAFFAVFAIARAAESFDAAACLKEKGCFMTGTEDMNLDYIQVVE